MEKEDCERVVLTVTVTVASGAQLEGAPVGKGEFEQGPPLMKNLGVWA